MNTMILALAVCGAVAGDGQETERQGFAFLKGVWELHERINHEQRTTETGLDRYEFEQPIAGGAIRARWRFNRGTEAKPDWADAIYVSGYHDPSKAWTFYYVSERSAQYWQGKKSGDVWYFYLAEPFDYQGRRALQRQWWEASGPDRLRRHFENSYDDGRTWQLVVTTVLRRVK